MCTGNMNVNASGTGMHDSEMTVAAMRPRPPGVSNARPIGSRRSWNSASGRVSDTIATTRWLHPSPARRVRRHEGGFDDGVAPGAARSTTTFRAVVASASVAAIALIAAILSAWRSALACMASA